VRVVTRRPVKPIWQRLERVRSVALLVVVFAAAALLAWFVNGRVPFENWLLWPYLGFAAAALGWLLSCLSVGHAALRAMRLRVPFRERLLFDVATGVLLFAVGLFVAGLFGLIRPPFFFVYPALLLAVGARWTFGDMRRAWRHLAAARRRASVRPSVPTLPYLAALVFGILGLTIVYLTIMVPENTAFDTRHYHLPIAEHYAAWGRIGKFPNGWFPGVLPHLASWLYTWPFTLRGVNLFGQVELAAHMELALFVVTVFSTPLLVEALCPGRRIRGSWAAFFLFPGLFLYDSSLSLAADHVMAFWAIPLALALRRMVRRPTDVPRAALVGLMMAGAILTKYQAIYLLVPAGLLVTFVVVRALWRGRRTSRARWWSLLRAPAALTLAALLATAPHWLANIVWHGNPVYPQLRHLFPSHPLVAGWPGMILDGGWEPTGTTFEKLKETIGATFSVGFFAHDWPHFHRDVPVFGFLFALIVPVLLVVRGAGRARVLAAGTLMAVFIWYWTYHQDRYLQGILPWMAATTAAALVLAWRSGKLARIGLVLLVGLQVAWGGDVPWIPGHAMMGDVPALRTLRLLSSTYRGDVHARWEFNTGFEELDKVRVLPKDAVVLLHEEYLKLGLNRRSLQDSLRLQAAIDYTQLARPDRVHDLFKSLGVTDMVWSRSHSPAQENALSAELVFFGYALRYGEARRDLGQFAVARLPARRPPANPPGMVVYAACNGTVHGVPLADIDRVAKTEGRDLGAGGDPGALLASAEFVVINSRCPGNLSSRLSSFIEAPRWGDLTIWVRRN